MKLAALKKLCDEATPGPWWVEGFGVESSHLVVADCIMGLSDRVGTEVESNTEFIAAAREALPKLIAVAEAAKASIPEFGCTEELFEAMQALEADA